LSVLYALYLFLLQKETFFHINRFFLLVIPIFSFLLPLLSFDIYPANGGMMSQPIERLSDIRMSYYDAMQDWSMTGGQLADGQVMTETDGTSFNEAKVHYLILAILLFIYGLGLLILITRLIWTCVWIRRLRVSHPMEVIDGVNVVKVSHPMTPFSFLEAVFVNKDMLHTEEFLQILAHEKTHIRQRHSIDLIFVQLLAAGLWFNPVVWLLIKSLKTTHEYIVDKKMINQGYSLVEYQTLLLRQLISNNSYGLVHNFNLSFIKKRITMMKIKESGWAGKVKVALVLSLVAVLGLLIVQCNAKIEDSVSFRAKSPSGLSESIDVPVLPTNLNSFDGDLSSAISLTIHRDQVAINDQKVELGEFLEVINEEYSDKNIVIMKVDQSQSMSLVRKVEWELRKADKRKLLYVGRTVGGDPVRMPFLLPPNPESDFENRMPKIDDQYAKENDIDVLKIDLGKSNGSVNQQLVYDFVNEQISRGRSNYVVSGKYDDSHTYREYLVNLHLIQEGFNQIYEERAQRMFGKGFREMSAERESSDQANEAYLSVRKGVPRAISVADQ